MSFLSCCFGSQVPDLGPDYTILHNLGAGAQGEVWKVEKKSTGQTYAVKIVRRGISARQLDRLSEEIKILATLGASHPNILSPKELILSASYLGLVTEYAGVGDLKDYCAKHDVDEDEACYIFRQVLAGVAYLHKNLIAYRDIKLENTLVTLQSPPRIMLCDFGVAKKLNKGIQPAATTITGTPGYMAPQLLEGLVTGKDMAPYDPSKADVWSCGALLYVLLAKSLPYGYEKLRAVAEADRGAALQQYRSNLAATWSRNSHVESPLSEEVKSLLDKMLVPEEALRANLDEVERHPWVTKPLPDKYEIALAEMDAERRANEVAYTSSLQEQKAHLKAIDSFIWAARRPDYSLLQHTLVLELRPTVKKA